MTENKYFYLDESVKVPGKYIIRMNPEAIPQMSTEGSFAILPARLMCLSYAQYLRFCRDTLGGEIRGKGNTYPLVFFEFNRTSLAFVKMLNLRMELVMFEKNHPDWQLHKDYLEEKERQKKENSNVFNFERFREE